MKIRSLGIGICLSLFGTFCLGGCSGSSPQPVSRTVTVFDTVVTITVYDKDSEDVLDACVAKCEDYNARFSRTSEGSEIYELNHANGEPVTLSGDTVDLIQKGVEYSRLADGKFDITIAPLSDLWDFKNNTGTVPDDAAIQQAKSHIGYENVRVDGNTVQLLDPEAAIDLGGIAKGYIADQLKAYLKEQNVSHALINLGGNVLALGGKPDGSDYNIGIQKPFAQNGEAITSVKIKDQSVVSSGTYERYFEKDGKTYHHIIDPATGYPADSGLKSVTIISSDGTLADGLSTSLFIMGIDKAKEYWRANSDKFDAILLTNDNKQYVTEGIYSDYSTDYPVEKIKKENHNE